MGHRCGGNRVPDGEEGESEAGELWGSLADLHHEACRLARPDPAALARRLLDLHVDTSFGIDVRGDYADVLADEGITAFEAEVRRRFAGLPTVRSADPPTYEPGRAALTELAVRLAETSGDVDELVEVLARDLSESTTYTRIVEALRRAGRDEESLRWAREGLAAYGGRTGVDLLDAALAIHGAAGRGEDARAEARRAFDTDPRLETYQRLAPWCRDLPGWEQERAAAIDAVRHAGDKQTSDLTLQGGTLLRLPHAHDMVRLFLWDGDDEAAWREAHTARPPISDKLWLEVAERRARTHQLEAAQVYRDQIERDIERRKNHTYAEAAAKIRRVGELMTAAGHDEDFTAYVAEVRRTHKRKINLMSAMDAERLP